VQKLLTGVALAVVFSVPVYAQGCPFNLNVRNDGPQPIWVQNFSNMGQGTASRVRRGGWRSLTAGLWRPYGSDTFGGDPSEQDYFFMLQPGEMSGDIFFPDPLQCGSQRRFKIYYTCDDGLNDGDNMIDYYPGLTQYTDTGELAVDGAFISIGGKCEAEDTPPLDETTPPEDTDDETIVVSGEIPPEPRYERAPPRTPDTRDGGDDRARDRGRDRRDRDRDGDRSDRGTPRNEPDPEVTGSPGESDDADGDNPDPGGFYDPGTQDVSLSCPSTSSLMATTFSGNHGDNFSYELGLGNLNTDLGMGGGVLHFSGAEIEAGEARMVCTYGYLTHTRQNGDPTPNNFRDDEYAQMSMGAAHLVIESEHGQCVEAAGFNAQGLCTGVNIPNDLDPYSFNGSGVNGAGMTEHAAETCRVVCQAPVVFTAGQN